MKYQVFPMNEKSEVLKLFCKVKSSTSDGAVSGLEKAIDDESIKTPKNYSGIIVVYPVKDGYEAGIPLANARRRKSLPMAQKSILQDAALPWETEEAEKAADYLLGKKV